MNEFELLLSCLTDEEINMITSRVELTINLDQGNEKSLELLNILLKEKNRRKNNEIENKEIFNEEEVKKI